MKTSKKIVTKSKSQSLKLYEKQLEIKYQNLGFQDIPPLLAADVYTIDSSVSEAEDKAADAPLEKADPLWEKAIQKAKKAEEVWDQIAKMSVLDAYAAKNRRDRWAAKIISLEVLRMNTKVQIAKSKTATLSHKIVAEKITEAEIILLWNEVLQKARETIAICKSLVGAYTAGRDQACEEYKQAWMEDLKYYEHIKVIWTANFLFFEAMKEANLALLARVKAFHRAKTEEEICALWTEAVKKAQHVDRTWEDALTASREGYNNSPREFKQDWVTNIAKIEEYKIFTNLNVIYCEAEKEGEITLHAWNKMADLIKTESCLDTLITF